MHRRSFLSLAAAGSAALALGAAAADEPRISADELKPLLEKGDALLIDVRSTASYDAGHADKALSIPLDGLGKRLGELPKDKLIAAYCT